MRAAPPVEVDLGAGRRERVLASLWWGLSAGVFVLWANHSFSAGFPSWTGMLPVIAAVGVAWRHLRPMAGQLIWTGQVWRWQAPDQPLRELARVQRALDLGDWMLLHCTSDARAGLWCGVSARQAGAAWHGLQLALRNRSGPATAGPPT